MLLCALGVSLFYAAKVLPRKPTPNLQAHKDSEGNVYDFAYGLNWKGIINDARTAKYKK